MSGREDEWRLTGFYCHVEAHLRHETWSLLRTLSLQRNVPWLCMGDFNEILYRTKKVGGTDRCERQMAEFRNALDVCNLRDMGFHGSPYTWSNGRTGEDCIRSRLN
ncbi:Exo_endo_phos domain-containing protein [Cephalotus follicularis]|uniref:Exo_endo_phos domain-containing protein n=1 Tax=Cephalotus follicularis TaxID=3775 RepID=A0A1Q3AW13_CEPFO|nr:Exo_endo_phos domain-containing protein [Cephalotus follicularis]